MFAHRIACFAIAAVVPACCGDDAPCVDDVASVVQLRSSAGNQIVEAGAPSLAKTSAKYSPSETNDHYEYVGAPHVGEWGGTCRCPSGMEYEVGDNYDSCGSLACIGGETVKACGQGVISPKHAGWKVTCGSGDTPLPSRCRQVHHGYQGDWWFCYDCKYAWDELESNSFTVTLKNRSSALDMAMASGADVFWSDRINGDEGPENWVDAPRKYHFQNLGATDTRVLNSSNFSARFVQCPDDPELKDGGVYIRDRVKDSQALFLAKSERKKLKDNIDDYQQKCQMFLNQAIDQEGWEAYWQGFSEDSMNTLIRQLIGDAVLIAFSLVPEVSWVDGMMASLDWGSILGDSAGDIVRKWGKVSGNIKGALDLFMSPVQGVVNKAVDINAQKLVQDVLNAGEMFTNVTTIADEAIREIAAANATAQQLVFWNGYFTPGPLIPDEKTNCSVAGQKNMLKNFVDQLQHVRKLGTYGESSAPGYYTDFYYGIKKLDDQKWHYYSWIQMDEYGHEFNPQNFEDQGLVADEWNETVSKMVGTRWKGGPGDGCYFNASLKPADGH